jgi:hypothetical protein
MSRFTKIIFGNGLDVTDLGEGVIQVDGGGAGMPGSAGPAGPAGATGPAGAAGAAGAAGVGVPVGGSTGQVLKKNSATDFDTGWATPAAGGGSVAADAIWDTKGDLAVATGADAASKLPAGPDGQVLTTDSTQTTGLKWAAATGGGGGYVPDPPPASPDAANAEFNSTALGSGWAIQSALGVSNAALGQWVDTPNSSASVWNAHTDIPGALVMQPYQGWRMKLWRAFAPGNTRWAIIAKVRLNQARSTDDRIRLGVDTSTSPDDNDSPGNSFFVELRAENGTSINVIRYEIGASYIQGGTAASQFFRDNWHQSFAYLAIVGSTGTSGTVEAYVSSDGISWLLVRGTNAGVISAAGAGIKSMFLTVNDVSLGSNCAGIIDFVRFLNGENRMWKAFGWT